LKFLCFVGDEKSHKEVFSLKGASGFKCCGGCLNVVGRTPQPVASDYFVHVKEAFARTALPHTTQTFDEIVDRLRAAGRGELARLQTQLGVNCEVGGLLFDDALRPLLNMPRCIYWDIQHCVCSSGGVGQYQVNQFARHLVHSTPGMTFAKLDEFCSSVVLPRSWGKLPRKFWEQRVRDSDGKHIKAFASEIITSVMMLDFFATLFLSPRRLMNEHVRCMAMLVVVLEFVEMGDRVMGFLPEFMAAVETHIGAFRALHPDCVTPKTHYVTHVPRNAMDSGVFVTCFGPEREHKISKAVANWIFNSLGKSLITRMVYQFEQRTLEAKYFQMPRLLHEKNIHIGRFFPDVINIPGVTELVEGRELRSHMGTYGRNDIVLYVVDASVHVGSVVALLKIVTVDGYRYGACVCRYLRVGGSESWCPTETVEFVVAESLRKTLLYIRMGEHIRPKFPKARA